MLLLQDPERQDTRSVLGQATTPTHSNPDSRLSPASLRSARGRQARLSERVTWSGEDTSPRLGTEAPTCCSGFSKRKTSYAQSASTGANEPDGPPTGQATFRVRLSFFPLGETVSSHFFPELFLADFILTSSFHSTALKDWRWARLNSICKRRNN